MQTKKRLTVAIPTYNRARLAIATVKQLNKQEGIDQCQILIVDNASLEPVLDVMLSSEPTLVHTVKFHRNVTNIGLAANLMRCIELAETEWLWILADDDEVSEDAIKNILAQCPEGSDLDYILFAIAEGDNGGQPTSSCHEFFQAVNSWSRLGFVSTGIYRTKSAQEHLTVGMSYTYSLFPFIGIVIHGLDSGRWKAALNECILVHPAHKAENTWALIASINGYTIAELPKDPRVGKRLQKLAKAWCLGPIGLLHDFALRRSLSDHSLSKISFKHKIYLIGRASGRLWLLSHFCHFLSLFPPVIVLHIIAFLRRISGRSVARTRGGEGVFGQI